MKPSRNARTSPGEYIRFAALAGAIAMLPRSANAVPITVDADWFATPNSPPAFYWGAGFGEGPFTFTATNSVRLDVTDDFAAGDRFEVFDFGSSIGSTSFVPAIGAPGIGPEAAFNSPTYSSGSFSLGMGSHSITFDNIGSPNAGRGYLRVLTDTPDCPVGSGVDLLPAGSIVEGKTIGQWTQDWWNWAHSFTSADDPASDPTGERANQGQSGNVFFVAGSKTGTVTRSFDVPADKNLLIPLVNVVYVRSAGEDPNVIRNLVRGIIDDTSELHLCVDGVGVSQAELLSHREESGFFDSIQPANSASGEPEGTWTNSFADSYTVMLPPLPPGNHEISFGGTVSGGFSFSVDVTDIITVLPVVLDGDFDVDGDVDGADFLVLQRGLGTIYDATDLAAWEANYGTVAPLSASSSRVPEPSTMGLLLLAAAGFCLWGRAAPL